ncbi:MAG: FeS assembly protein SufD, Fe-S cluster assembly protein SufD [Candidatus Gottesmanbacteria bacterium GW2011_GWA2_43_14]|uniref:FeS assembly protein SufD, Fe-S cluster assembly protein SufD n=1 Tax=Candidatus Gottesmanbacteria bacterium GW2011_GWA2_43_14 TaxID=1618443 RepID=A0A0G1DEW1_9BACT|nr:MAG: FeS assembly protein SufD, Fe-S cluster assembly protein SufD [Candidatus Gottesmanbacteria bacterium GW2011_GWA2_43_14]
MVKSEVVLIDKLTGLKKFKVRSDQRKTFVIYLTGNDNRTGSLEIAIDGSRSQVDILGFILGRGKQTLKLTTLQDHLKEQSVSDLLIKSVLFDSSRLYYEGTIRIRKGAQKSNAYQKNDNILMSKGTWADSRPKLEILANDVRCTHGATVGRIDDEQLYYLKTRGLTGAKASVLVLSGFFRQAAERIDDLKIRQQLTMDLDNKIGRLVV